MDEKKNITPVLSDETDAASVPDAGELRRKKKRQRQLVTSILLVVFAAVLIAVYFIVAPLLSEDGNAADPAPFPSMVVVYNGKRSEQWTR